MQPTRYPEVNEIVGELLSLLQAVLGDNLRGLYLFGSAAVGAFERDVSDVDLLAVTAAFVCDREFGALQTMHQRVAQEYPRWDDRVEILHASAQGLSTFRNRVVKVAAISPGEPFHWRDAEPGRLANWYDVQQNGVTLFGPPPRVFIASISEAEFVESVRGDLEQWPHWLEEVPPRTGAQSYVVLTMCRALSVCRFGKQLSKLQAGLWAKDELPEWADIIETALGWRRTSSGGVQESVDERTLARIGAFVQFARESAARLN